MKKVFTSENNFVVHNAKNLIEAQGIEVFIKNEFAQGAVGEISTVDSWPEVWVLEDADFDRATAIIEPLQSHSQGAEWVCQNCSELNDPSFEICWNCQQEMPQLS